MRDLAASMYQYHTAALSYLENPGTIEDVNFFTNASIATGVKQSAVTNDSSEAWKLTLSSGWSYPQIVLDDTYDISNHQLVMDVMATDTSVFQLYLAVINGKWPYTAAKWYGSDKWITVTFDLAGNSLGIIEMSRFQLGVNMVATSENCTLYIDNVRLVNQEGVVVDWIYQRISRMFRDQNGRGIPLT